MINLGSFKELYDVSLKTTFPFKILNKEFEEGEVIARFDKIQVAGLEQIKDFTSANGGFDNRARVIWETTKELNLTFSQGVFSKTHFGLLSNSNLVEIPKGDKVKISKREEIETNENGCFILKEKPLEKLFVYNKNTGDKLTVEKIDDFNYKIENPFLDLVVDYIYEYENGATSCQIGKRLVEGYLSFEGKTKIKDDTSGKVVTGIIFIPKIKIVSNLSLRLGSQASPTVANFSAIGLPVGTRHNSYVMDFISLNNDIDSDI